MIRLLLPLVLMAAIVGCENEGPAERAGENLDEAAESVRDEARDMGNRVEDACEEATGENC